MILFAGLTMATLLALPRLWVTGSTFAFPTRPAPAPASEPAPTRIDEASLGTATFVVLNVSGGGSRAAVFAAAVLAEMQELAMRDCGCSFVRHIGLISSVSGGSLVGTYLALHFPELQDARPNTTTDKSWARFQDSMAQDLTGGAIRRLLGRPWRLFSLAWGEPWGALIAEAMDELVFNGVTLDQLPPRPTLLINATEDVLGPFVFSNSIHVGNEPTARCGADRPVFLPSVPPDPVPLTLDWAGIDRASFPIAQAVYASAAVPGLLTPMLLRGFDDRKEPQYLKLIDGGVWDNTGVASSFTLLDQILGASCTNPSPTSILIIGIDANNAPNLRIDLRATPSAEVTERLRQHLASDRAATLTALPRVVDLIFQRREDLQGDYYAATYRPLLRARYPAVQIHYERFALDQLRTLAQDEIDQLLEQRQDIRKLWEVRNIRSGFDLWTQITGIPTDFQIDAGHRELLQIAAALIVESSRGIDQPPGAERHPGQGWSALLRPATR